MKHKKLLQKLLPALAIALPATLSATTPTVARLNADTTVKVNDHRLCLRPLRCNNPSGPGLRLLPTLQQPNRAIWHRQMCLWPQTLRPLLPM